jgi:soluble lytic murein transglycosylase-like protein
VLSRRIRKAIGTWTRGRAPACVLALALGAGAWGTARAGAQQYEPLSDSVRGALAASLVDRLPPPEARYASTTEKLDWLAEMGARLPLRHKPTLAERTEFLHMVRYEAQRAGLDPQLVLGLIQVESGFRRHAISSAGARGYMQVMPFWTGLIGDGNPSALFDVRTNLRYGCTILRHYLDIERGDLYRALGRYNGSLGRPEYPNAVLAAWQRWAWSPQPRLQQVSAPAGPAVAMQQAPTGPSVALQQVSAPAGAGTTLR